MSGCALGVSEQSDDPRGSAVPAISPGAKGSVATARSPLAIGRALPFTFLIAVVVLDALFVGLLRFVLRTASQFAARALKQAWS